MTASAHSKWTPTSIPSQAGRVIVVTGATSGVGLELARQLAERHARLVLACRDIGKAERAAAAIREHARRADVSIVRLDLTSLASIREAAASVGNRFGRIHVLVNNAGVMRPPYTKTADGFELQLATNHLGHFALTGLLLDLLYDVPGSRIVTVASPAHRQGRIDFDDLQSERHYSRGAAYAQSKLANLLFTHELQRRLEAARAQTIALAAHPGLSRTQLNKHLPIPFRGRSWGLVRPLSHPASAGALSILRAAADPGARGGEYYGPDGPLEFKGDPVQLESSPRSHDRDVQRRLWVLSEELTGIAYDRLAHRPLTAPTT
jgi:NAD(P)-dependent dehydrogenase (short-subunit alcohol dehydrogenase family)